MRSTCVPGVGMDLPEHLRVLRAAEFLDLQRTRHGDRLLESTRARRHDVSAASCGASAMLPEATLETAHALECDPVERGHVLVGE